MWDKTLTFRKIPFTHEFIILTFKIYDEIYFFVVFFYSLPGYIHYSIGAHEDCRLQIGYSGSELKNMKIKMAMQRQNHTIK